MLSIVYLRQMQNFLVCLLVVWLSVATTSLLMKIIDDGNSNGVVSVKVDDGMTGNDCVMMMML